MLKLDRVSEIPWGSEAREYLEGVLAADPLHRMDNNPHRNIQQEICLLGSATPAFWRGVLEGAGWETFGISQPPHGKTQIWVRIYGSYHFLTAFLEFLEDECNRKHNKFWPYDAGGKLAAMLSSGVMRIYGRQAQEAVCAIFPPGYTFCRESSREKVERIRQHMFQR